MNETTPQAPAAPPAPAEQPAAAAPSSKALGLVLALPGAALAPHRLPGIPGDLYPDRAVALDELGIDEDYARRWIAEHTPAAEQVEFEPGTGRELRRVAVQASCPVELVELGRWKWKPPTEQPPTEQLADLASSPLAAAAAADAEGQEG